MARKLQIRLKDDIDGSPTDQTAALGLDGRDYEIDLSAGMAERLREVMRQFVAAAGKATGDSRRTHPTRHTSGTAAKTPAIRAWAKKHGHQISDRGRITA